MFVQVGRFEMVLIDAPLQRSHRRADRLPYLGHDLFLNLGLAAAEDDRREQLPEAVNVADFRGDLATTAAPLHGEAPTVGNAFGGEVAFADQELLAELALALDGAFVWEAGVSVLVPASTPPRQPEDVWQPVLDRCRG